MTGYSRSCGVSLAACGASECRCVPVDPEPLGGRENGSCVIHADPDLLAKVDNAPEKPSEALQRLFDTTRSDT